jgi:CRISPR locus-related DNA-binding protein
MWRRREVGKTVILSFGFDVGIVMRTLSDYSLRSGDSIVLVVPDDDSEKKISSIKEVEKFVSTLAERGLSLSLKIMEVDDQNIEESVMKICEYMLSHPDNEFYLEASGGVRSICTAITITAMLMGNMVKSFATLSEAASKKMFVDVPPYDNTLSDAKMVLLGLLSKPLTIKEISSRMKKNISTVSRHLEELEKKKLVRKDGEGYGCRYSLTPYGRIALQMREGYNANT